MWRKFTLVIVFTASATTAPAGTSGERKDSTRNFSERNCQYTLIGDDWKWRVGDPQSIVFSAENKKGTVVILATNSISPTTQLTADFAERLEAVAFGRQTLTRRGGRFLVFQGQVCYQSETRLQSGNTMACRVFFARGSSYALAAIGGLNPIEKDRDFEAIMNGFTFAEPPAAESKETASRFADYAPYSLGIVLLVMVILLPRLLPSRTAPQGH
jgi:hypothetical protein